MISKFCQVYLISVDSASTNQILSKEGLSPLDNPSSSSDRRGYLGYCVCLVALSLNFFHQLIKVTGFLFETFDPTPIYLT